jgi:hypothetical protein
LQSHQLYAMNRICSRIFRGGNYLPSWHEENSFTSSWRNETCPGARPLYGGADSRLDVDDGTAVRGERGCAVVLHLPLYTPFGHFTRRALFPV